MPEFRIEGHTLRREVKLRILSWGTVLLLVAITAFLVVLPVLGHTAGPNVDLLAVSAFLCAVFGACFLVCREALHYAARQMSFVLEDSQIVRKRPGYSELRIGFSDIGKLSEELGWLIICSNTVPRVKIAIPESVKGYSVIRAELTKHHPLVPAPRFPLKSSTLTVISVLSWAGVLLIRDMRVVIPAGVIGLALLAFGSYKLWIVVQRKFLVLGCLCCVWIAAVFLTYAHAMRR